MLTKRELIEILTREVTITCPEYFERMFSKYIKISIGEVIEEYSKRGHDLQYIGGGLFMYRY